MHLRHLEIVSAKRIMTYVKIISDQHGWSLVLHVGPWSLATKQTQHVASYLFMEGIAFL